MTETDWAYFYAHWDALTCETSSDEACARICDAWEAAFCYQRGPA